VSPVSIRAERRIGRTQTGATFVLALKKRRRQSGQALTEYAFLLVLLATITFAVVVLAGNQLQGTFQDVSYELSHLTDASTVAPRRHAGTRARSTGTDGSTERPQMEMQLERLSDEAGPRGLNRLLANRQLWKNAIYSIALITYLCSFLFFGLAVGNMRETGGS